MLASISRHISKRAVKAAIALLTGCVTISGCAQKPSYDIDSADDALQEYSKWEYDGSAFVEPKEKNEMITAHADASGTVKSIEDAVTLKGIADLAADGGQKKAVRDKSSLKDISNKNGDESFALTIKSFLYVSS